MQLRKLGMGTHAMSLKRRELLAGAPAAGLIGVLPTRSRDGAIGQDGSDIYQVDDVSTIMAAAREIIKEDWVGVLITIDASGMPRARPVGVNDPTDDWSLWISTRRGSRKTGQIEANPKAALHFGFDDIENGTKSSFYASFLGLASVHTDPQSIAAHGPPEQYRAQWPAYPEDLALIRFAPQRMEVMGKGIMPDQRHWQPQGLMLPPRA
ncbi:pyridoxamine 5'-phosphate oxidase family protein [Parafrankia sp. BMG5.11]|nr:pyridoxamine 5'-phosphate oxidase family protein [Parafrankia sp. BMG5.11]